MMMMMANNIITIIMCVFCIFYNIISYKIALYALHIQGDSKIVLRTTKASVLHWQTYRQKQDKNSNKSLTDQ